MVCMTALTNTCYAYKSFMHLRAMLFRPIIMHIGIDGYLETKSITHKIDPVVKDKTLTYAMSCVNTAISLIDFLYKRFVVDLKSNREWWWSPYREPAYPSPSYASHWQTANLDGTTDTSTAGLVLVMAQTSATLWSHVQVSLVEKAWDSCQDMLAFGATNNHFHEKALRFLWGVNKRIAGVRVLENKYDAIKPTVTRSYQRTPHSQYVNPNRNSNAPLQASNPNRGPSVFPYAGPSSLNAAPFTVSAASANFTAMSSASNEMVSSGSGPVANATFANYNAVPYAPLPNASTVPPFTASSSVDTAPFTAPWASGAVPPFNGPASTVYPVSANSGSGHFPFSWDPNMIQPAAPESAEASYTVASNSMAVTSADSSGYTIAPYATSSQWNTIPYATSSESATHLHTDGTNSTTAPMFSSVAPASYTGPYTAFSDPNATLYTEESADLNGAVWQDMSAYNLTPSSSSTMTGLSPSNPNLADYGNMEDIDGTGMETQVFYQPYTKRYAYYSPDDDASMACNEQS